MLTIYIDADACPVRDAIFEIAGRHQILCHVVSNSYMRLPQSPLINRQIVSNGFDAADNWIVENIQPDDIAITSDIPLAARCLGAGAVVIGPGGKIFTNQTIGMALALRDLKSHLGETGQIKRHNPAFSKKDRSEFRIALENAIQKILRQK